MRKRKDHFYQRAKAEGYRSRASYKLREISRRFSLIRHGDRVGDLGSWPGGWLQVALELVGPAGFVVGVDLQPVELEPEPRLVVLQGDVREARVQEEILSVSGGRLDVLLSDMAPKLSGVRVTDEARCAELLEVALVVAGRVLRPGGRMVVKVFAGSELKRLEGAVRERFVDVRLTRPEATRSGSAEHYLVGLAHRGGRSLPSA